MELSSELAVNADVISGLFARMGDFEERLAKATSSPPTLSATTHTELPALAREFSNFKILVWQALTKLKAQTDLLARGFDRHETYMRRKVLLIHGVAEKKEEKVSEVVLDIISNKLQLPDITICDLQVCHRLGTSTTKPRSILVRFRDIEQRRLVWDTKTMLKESGVVISEFLTKTRHDVFMAARKHFGVRNSWTTDGKIIILLPDKTRRKIETVSDLQNLTALFPAVASNVPAPDTGTSVAAVPSKPAQPTRSAAKSSAATATGTRRLRGRPT